MNQLKKSFILLLVISLLVSTTNIQVFALSSLFDQSEIMDSNKESNHIDVIEEAEDKQEKHGNVEEVEDTQEKQESVEGAEDTQEKQEDVNNNLIEGSETDQKIEVSEEEESDDTPEESITDTEEDITNFTMALTKENHIKRISKFYVENNKLLYDGYSYIQGVNIPNQKDIIQKLKFVDANTGKQVQTFTLNNFYSSAVSQDPNHGNSQYNYDWAKFKGTLDISSLAIGEYKIKIYTNAKGNQYDEIINFHSSIGDFKFSSRGKIFSFIRDHSSLKLTVTEDLNYNPMDQYVKRISYFYEYEGYIYMNGYSYVKDVEIPNKGDIIQKLKFVNTETGKQVKTYLLDNYYSNALSKDPNHGGGKVNYDYGKFESYMNIDDLPSGEYYIKIYTNAKGQSYDEIINFHSSIPAFEFKSLTKKFEFSSVTVNGIKTMKLKVSNYDIGQKVVKSPKSIQYSFYDSDNPIVELKSGESFNISFSDISKDEVYCMDWSPILNDDEFTFTSKGYGMSKIICKQFNSPYFSQSYYVKTLPNQEQLKDHYIGKGIIDYMNNHYSWKKNTYEEYTNYYSSWDDDFYNPFGEIESYVSQSGYDFAFYLPYPISFKSDEIDITSQYKFIFDILFPTESDEFFNVIKNHGKTSKTYQVDGRKVKVEYVKYDNEWGWGEEILYVYVGPAKTNTNKISKIHVDRTDLTLTKGYTHSVNTLISPSNTINRALLWTSSNPSVATVDTQGTITGVSTGTATITVSSATNPEVKEIIKVDVVKNICDDFMSCIGSENELRYVADTHFRRFKEDYKWNVRENVAYVNKAGTNTRAIEFTNLKGKDGWDYSLKYSYDSRKYIDKYNRVFNRMITNLTYYILYPSLDKEAPSEMWFDTYYLDYHKKVKVNYHSDYVEVLVGPEMR